MQKHATERY